MRKYRFSQVELKHLSIGTLLFTAVMVSLLVFSFSILTIILLVIFTAPMFFLHEIGHKINAQKFQLWAEFRLDPQGVLLTAVSIIPFFPIKFIAPGDVMIRANDYSEVPAMGKVAGYGPAINILLGGLYLIVAGISVLISVFTPYDLSLLFEVFFYASGFGFFLGLFNMIPFGPLDGRKVKYWNDTVFWILIIVAGLLTLETYISTVFISTPFFLGTYLSNIDPAIGTFYPLALGIVSFGIGYYLVNNLADPAWDPGKRTVPFNDFRDYHYYNQSPQIKTTRMSTGYSSSAPMNAPCSECGKRDLLPFRCSSCQKIFCAEHRLPGMHFCVVDSK